MESLDWPTLIRSSWPNSYQIQGQGSRKAVLEVQDNSKTLFFWNVFIHWDYQQILLTITKSPTTTIGVDYYNFNYYSYYSILILVIYCPITIILYRCWVGHYANTLIQETPPQVSTAEQRCRRRAQGGSAWGQGQGRGLQTFRSENGRNGAPSYCQWPFQEPIDWSYLPYIRPIYVGAI